MHRSVAIVLSAALLAGCSSGNWTPTRWIDTPAGQAEMQRLNQEAAQRTVAANAEADERRVREAAYWACQEGNANRERVAKLYSQTQYEYVNCQY